MKNLSQKIILGTLSLLFSAAVFSQTSSENHSKETLRVLTFNIWHGEKYYKTNGSDYESSLEILADVINKANPDLVALQEVDNRTGRSKGVDLATELGLLTKMNPLFGATMKFNGGEYGLGVLSKFSFQSSEIYKLYTPEGSEPRAALETIIQTDSGEKIRFVSTHFDHRENDTRKKQSEDVNAFFTDDPIFSIIAGDFNATPKSEPIQTLKKEWKISCKNNVPTSPSIDPRSKIDYIMYRNAKKWRLAECRVIEEKVASDHNPVLAVFERIEE